MMMHSLLNTLRGVLPVLFEINFELSDAVKRNSMRGGAAIKGTLQIHQILCPQGTGIFNHSKLSCYCVATQLNGLFCSCLSPACVKQLVQLLRQNTMQSLENQLTNEQITNSWNDWMMWESWISQKWTLCSSRNTAFGSHELHWWKKKDSVHTTDQRDDIEDSDTEWEKGWNEKKPDEQRAKKVKTRHAVNVWYRILLANLISKDRCHTVLESG